MISSFSISPNYCTSCIQWHCMMYHNMLLLVVLFAFLFRYSSKKCEVVKCCSVSQSGSLTIGVGKELIKLTNQEGSLFQYFFPQQNWNFLQCYYETIYETDLKLSFCYAQRMGALTRRDETTFNTVKVWSVKGKMGKRKDMSDFEKGQILMAEWLGQSILKTLQVL